MSSLIRKQNRLGRYRRRLGMALGNNIFMDKKRLFTGKLNLELKKQSVWSVTLYAAETWTLTQADRRKLEAFEMWILLRMEKIS